MFLRPIGIKAVLGQCFGDETRALLDQLYRQPRERRVGEGRELDPTLRLDLAYDDFMRLQSCKDNGFGVGWEW